LVRAVVALPDVRAESGCTACGDVPEGLELLARENISPALEEFLSVPAEDIGDFEPIGVHGLRTGPAE
jgi:hypothetical protein